MAGYYDAGSGPLAHQGALAGGLADSHQVSTLAFVHGCLLLRYFFMCAHSRDTPAKRR